MHVVASIGETAPVDATAGEPFKKALSQTIMRYDDRTSMGGTYRVFLTTHWSLIDHIQAGEDRDRALINLLLERYWKPVYCYLRRKGWANEAAKDLTQGFFHEVVLNRELVLRADRSKGRFRSFLLHALNQYVINQNEKETSRMRIPRNKMVSLECIDSSEFPQDMSGFKPDASYNYAWVSVLLDRVLAAVKKGCCDEGLRKHWDVFHARVVQPILDGAAAPTLRQICAEMGIEDARHASNMIITVKRRFRQTLRRQIRTTVVSDDEVDEELEEIVRFLPEGAQDFS
jgi:RNA polymerase sigma-70 factor (ECF subfamily)